MSEQTDQIEGADDHLVVACDAFLAASKKVKGLDRSQSNYGITVYNLFEEVKKVAEGVNRTSLAQAIFKKDNSVPIEVQMLILNQMEIGTA